MQAERGVRVQANSRKFGSATTGTTPTTNGTTNKSTEPVKNGLTTGSNKVSIVNGVGGGGATKSVIKKASTFDKKTTSSDKTAINDKKTSNINDKKAASVEKKVSKTSSTATIKNGTKGSSQAKVSGPEKSIEQLLTEALQLTDDEKACLLASQQKKESLVQKLQQQREQDLHSQHHQQNQPQQQLSTSSLGAASPSLSRGTSSALTSSKSGGESPPAERTKVATLSPAVGKSSPSPLLEKNNVHGAPPSLQQQQQQPQQQKTPEINFESSVDYAKTRFINSAISASNKPSEAKPTQNLVNEAKSRWEPSNNVAASNGSTNGSSKAQFYFFVSTSNRYNNVTTTSSGPTAATAAATKSGFLEDQHPAHRAQQQRLSNLAAAQAGRSPTKPFLSKGSVAERVMLFEKCPELRSASGLNKDAKRAKSPLYCHWKTSSNNRNNQMEGSASNGLNADNNSASNSSLPNSSRQLLNQSYQRKSSLRRSSWKNSSFELPRFYYPHGKPYTSLEIENQVRRIRSEFDILSGRRATRQDMPRIARVCGIPVYWKEPLFLAVQASATKKATGSNSNTLNSSKSTSLACEDFIDYWKRVLSMSYDEPSRFVRILSKGQRNYLLPEDFMPMIQDIVDSHPGLSFLREAVEFHSRYVHTVIARIYYCVNKSWSGKISIPELRKSNFLAVLSVIDDEEDINQITYYFSYEHFYVIYCKFWELDKDHDLIIDKYDLSKHNDGAISSRMIDRIFSGAVTRGPVRKHGKMSYSEFVWFLLSEEDKRQPRSIEYWFRCMDIDGDGILSMYELEYFYEEQVRRMEAIGIEALPFTDCLCQMMDMVRPQGPGNGISLSDLKRCRMTPIFFDTFFNLDKYLDHEQRDPFSANKGEDDGPALSDWERFAADEYELLVAEEGGSTNSSSQNAEIINYEREPHTMRERDSAKTSSSSGGGGARGTDLGSVPDYVIATSKKYGLKARLHDEDDVFSDIYADV